MIGLNETKYSLFTALVVTHPLTRASIHKRMQEPPQRKKSNFIFIFNTLLHKVILLRGFKDEVQR